MPSPLPPTRKATLSVPVPAKLSSLKSTETLDIPDFRWVGLKKIKWVDPLGKERPWECAFRTTRRSECDGVAVTACVKYPRSRRETQLVLVTQFRPPVAAEVLEAPAGLVDAGEDAAAAAERELFEETGLRGKVTRVSPIVPCDAGLTSATMRYAIIEIDGDAEENKNAQPHPEDGEFITVRRIPLSSLLQQVEAWAAAGFQVDARLYAFAVGHGLGTELGGLDAPASRGRGGRKLCLRRIACYAVHAGVVAAALLAGRWMGRRSVR